MPGNGKTTRYEGRIFRIVEEEHRFGDEVKTFERAQRAPGVRIIVPSDDQLLITREFRPEQGGQDFRLPGGKVFDSLTEFETALADGTDIMPIAERAARKELTEETGLTPLSLRFLHRSPCGATVDWDLYYFVVDEFTLAEGGQALETGEEIVPTWISRAEAEAMCLDGRIGEERSALVLLRYLKWKFA